jgi:hypothetical protein
VVAAPSGFTKDAQRFALAAGIQLWDGNHLSTLSVDAGASVAEASGTSGD